MMKLEMSEGIVHAPDVRNAQDFLQTSLIRPGHGIYTNADGMVLFVRPNQGKEEEDCIQSFIVQLCF